tara:strand:- start:165 stop:959 length:795 start_codon:yes stop_codon:yes gene_type:complete
MKKIFLILLILLTFSSPSFVLWADNHVFYCKNNGPSQYINWQYQSCEYPKQRVSFEEFEEFSKKNIYYCKYANGRVFYYHKQSGKKSVKIDCGTLYESSFEEYIVANGIVSITYDPSTNKQVLNTNNKNQQVIIKTNTLDKEAMREELIYWKGLFEEKLISKEDYDMKRKELISGTSTTFINKPNIQNSNQNINQIRSEIEIEKAKLEQMKLQTEIALKALEEQKRIAKETKNQTLIERQRQNEKLMKKGLCLMNGGSFLSCNK